MGSLNKPAGTQPISRGKSLSTTYLTGTPNELREQFVSLKSPRDVANLLDVPYSQLARDISPSTRTDRYRTFYIPKRSGDDPRKINAPTADLKLLQRKLNQVLQHVYKPKPSVHGFVLGRNIVTNANFHKNQRWVLNLDLQDFFPSINIWRVIGLFKKVPYNLPEGVATVLALICCHDDQLPQGAPTSPVISNMICARMDTQLQRLAKRNRCTYSRYADDLTFSTSTPCIPRGLAEYHESHETGPGKVVVRPQLVSVIKANGFEINEDKVRLQMFSLRQSVTGLTVNKKVNTRRNFIRQTRAMLHAWEKFGLDAAEAEFRNKYGKKYRSPSSTKPKFRNVVRGKLAFLGMVRGQSDGLYLYYLDKFKRLDITSPGLE